MRKLILCLMLMIFALPVFSLTDLCPGDRVPDDAQKVEYTLIMEGPSQLRDLWEWSDGNISYRLGVDKEGIVRFISPNDPSAQTEEGIRVGDSFKKIKAIPSIKIAYWFEWGYCVVLPSGWVLQFSDNECYDYMKDGVESFRLGKKISDGARVICIFKSRVVWTVEDYDGI